MTMWKEGDRYPLSEKALAAYKAWREAERADMEAYRRQYPVDPEAPTPEIYRKRRHARA